MLFSRMVASWRGNNSRVMREAQYHVSCLFYYDEEHRHAEHEEAIKTPDPFDFAPKGLNKSAQGRGDASYASVAVALGSRGDASVAVALGSRGSNVWILFQFIASALKGRNTRYPCLIHPFTAGSSVPAGLNPARGGHPKIEHLAGSLP
jgi:hypothetical protein